MKKILALAALLICSLAGFSQSKGYARYDSFYITKTGGFGELILENHTQDSLGFLLNIGQGRTEFRRPLYRLTDSTYLVGFDTLKIPPASTAVTEPKEQFFGQMYSATSWASASTGFDNTGATVSLSAGKLVISGGAGDYVKALVIQKPSQLDKWNVGGNFILGTVTGSSYGFGVGKYGVGKSGSVKLLARFTSYTGGGNLLIDAVSTAGTVTNLYTSPTPITFATGDKVHLGLTRDGMTITATVRNLTTNGAPIRATVDATPSFASQAFSIDNIGEYGVFTFGGSVTVDSLGVYSKVPKNAALALVGDSKTQGYDVTAQSNRLSDMLNKYYNSTINLGGGNEITADFSARTYEIIALHPKAVLMVGASNAPRYSEAGYIARYDSIVTALQAAGINVFHSTGFAETSPSTLDQSPLNNHIYATYPADHIIETYTATNVPGAFYSDGVHPNNFGDSLALNAILKANKIPNGNTKFETGPSAAGFAGTPNYLPKFTGTGTTIGNSTLSDDGATQMTTTEAMQARGFTVYNPTGGTDGKLWNIYYSGDYLNYTTVDDARTTNGTPYIQAHRVGNSVDQLVFNEPVLLNPGSASGAVVQVQTGVTHVGYNMSGPTTGYFIPLQDNESVAAGMFISMQNASSASGAYSGAYFATTGTNNASGSPFVAFRDNNDGNEYVIGRNNATKEFNINYGSFNQFSSGNGFAMSSVGQIRLGGALAKATHSLNLAGGLNVNADSIPLNLVGAPVGIAANGDLVKVQVDPYYSAGAKQVRFNSVNNGTDTSAASLTYNGLFGLYLGATSSNTLSAVPANPNSGSAAIAADFNVQRAVVLGLQNNVSMMQSTIAAPPFVLGYSNKLTGITGASVAATGPIIIGSTNTIQSGSGFQTAWNPAPSAYGQTVIGNANFLYLHTFTPTSTSPQANYNYILGQSNIIDSVDHNILLGYANHVLGQNPNYIASGASMLGSGLWYKAATASGGYVQTHTFVGMYNDSLATTSNIFTVGIGLQPGAAGVPFRKNGFTVDSLGNAWINSSSTAFRPTGSALTAGRFRFNSDSAGRLEYYDGTNFQEGATLADIRAIATPAPATGTPGTLAKNQVNVSHGSSLNTYPLPTTAAEADLFIVLGEGTGGWKISQNAGQQIVASSFTTTAGTAGFIASGSRYAIVSLRCIVANTTFSITGQQGTINYN